MAMTITPPGAALAPTDDTFRDPVRASQHIFRVLLDALANPGTARQLIVHPQVAMEDADLPHIASVLVTMLDHEVSLHVAPESWAGALIDLAVRRTRVAIARATDADVVVASSALDPSLPERLKRGSLEFPDDGATLIVHVPSLTDPGDDALSLTLAGPGIPETRDLRLPLPEAAICSRNRAVSNYPTGIDLLVIDDGGLVAGIPRTTDVTILEGAR